MCDFFYGKYDFFLTMIIEITSLQTWARVVYWLTMSPGSSAASVRFPEWDVRLLFWKVRLRFNYDNWNYCIWDISKCGVLVNIVTSIVSRVGSIPGVGCATSFFSQSDFVPVRLLFCKVLSLSWRRRFCIFHHKLIASFKENEWTTRSKSSAKAREVTSR